MWAQGEVVLLTVGSEKVSRSEVEYHFSRSLEKRADVFTEKYGRFKQKVLYAKELGLDTLSEHIRRKTILSEVMTSRGQKNEAVRTGKEWVKLVHVTYPLKQSATKVEQQRGKAYMDSLYLSLKGNSNFQMEEIPWMQTRYLLNEWKAALKNLAQSELSKPFLSPQGIHIVAWKEKTYEQPLQETNLASFEEYRLKALEEGLLVAALDEALQQRLVCTEQDLERYFKMHYANYGGGTPHFRGAIISCQSKKEEKIIKKFLKKIPEALWKDAASRLEKEQAVKCRIEYGMFAIGINPFVDKLVFKCGDFQSSPDYPHVWVMGKRMKKGPENYRDVQSKVAEDCLEAKKKAETESFVQKYVIEINKEVLKTVNRAGI
jgi:peptidyl-prolyl cis-trans isomerase SurA